MKYITGQGDTFDLIALNVYGSEEFTALCMSLLPEYIETAVFDAGIAIELPEMRITDSDKYLPPWRR